MKITEQTTLAELQAYLETLGNPFLTVMKTHPNSQHARHAIAYLPNVGSFNGGGNTEAEAIEDALAELRAAMGITNLAYEPLNYIKEKPSRVGISLREQTERIMNTLTPREREVLQQRLDDRQRAARDPAFNRFQEHADQVCHGCGHTRDEHPNDSGCERWHADAEQAGPDNSGGSW
jgi:hypothetical protein